MFTDNPPDRIRFAPMVKRPPLFLYRSPAEIGTASAARCFPSIPSRAGPFVSVKGPAARMRAVALARSAPRTEEYERKGVAQNENEFRPRLILPAQGRCFLGLGRTFLFRRSAAGRPI